MIFKPKSPTAIKAIPINLIPKVKHKDIQIENAKFLTLLEIYVEEHINKITKERKS